MSERDINNSTLRHVGSFIRGAMERKDEDQMEAWRRERWLACTIYNMLQPKNKQITPSELMPLPGDEKKDTAKKASTPEEIQALVNQFNQR